MLNQSQNGSDPASAGDYFLSLMNYSNKTIFCQSPATSDTASRQHASKLLFLKVVFSLQLICEMFFLFCLSHSTKLTCKQQHMLRLAIMFWILSRIRTNYFRCLSITKSVVWFEASHRFIVWSNDQGNLPMKLSSVAACGSRSPHCGHCMGKYSGH